jgi:hypothetical protein
MIANFFSTIFSAITTTLILAAVGSVVGIAAALASRFVGGLSSYGIAAGVGAIMLVGTYGTGYLGARGDCKSAMQVAQLQAEKDKLAHDLAALNEVRNYESQQSKHQAEQLAEAQALYLKVVEAIAKHKDDGSCPIAAFEDELKAIGEMK